MLMSFFNRNKNPAPQSVPQDTLQSTTELASTRHDALANLVLQKIKDGVVITDQAGVIRFINPAAAVMTGCGSAENALGLDWGLVIKIEGRDGSALADENNPIVLSLAHKQVLDEFNCNLIVAGSNNRVPVSISLLPAVESGNFIFYFRDIRKELAEENDKSDFISTASHEMRTPVASIEGYLSLALNPQTATIDERARGYLDSAHSAAQHLGRLFRDLLDTTKLEDGRIKPKFVPVEMTTTVKQFTKDYLTQASSQGLTLIFGDGDPSTVGTATLPQVIYGYVDTDFLREIMGNLIENAIKYTPSGGSVRVSVKADASRILIAVADTGIGISPEDLEHIFQKFYRADNSDTRTIGGTGLGLYLAKQRVEALGGRIWAESVYSKGSTFYVSLPRISNEEYDKRMIAINNNMNNPEGGKQ